MTWNAKRTALLLTSAAAGFAAGIGLLLDAPRRGGWFGLNAPGAYVAFPFAHPGLTVWAIPLCNAIGYAALMALLIRAVGFAREFRR